MASAAFDRTRLSIRDVYIVAAVYLTSFLIVAGFPHALMGFPLDDSWIHQVVARNLVRYGTLGFIPGVWSSGSSSLLWTFVIAANLKFFPALNPVIYSGLLNVLFLIATGLGLLAITRKDGLPQSSCWIFALTPALDGNFIWLGLLGMEHLLFVALSVLGIYLWFKTSLRSAILCALCLGALSMTRPEGMVLAFLAVLVSRWAHRGRRDIIILISMVTVSVAAFLSTNLFTSHSLLPITYIGRKWLYFGSAKVPYQARLAFPVTLARTILRPWTTHATFAFFYAIVLTLIMFGLLRLFRERRLCTGVLCVWNFVLIGAYLVMLPTGSHAGRYEPLFLTLNFPLMFLGMEMILSSPCPFLTSRRSRIAFQTTGLVVAYLLCGFFSLRLWREVTWDGITVVESTHARMAYFVAGSISPAKVAAFDIGRVGFIDEGEIVDLGGLTDNSFLPYMRQQQITKYLEDRNIQYLIWPSDKDGASYIPQVLVMTPEIRRGLTKIARFCAPEPAWTISYAATLVAAPCQVLYRRKSGVSQPKISSPEPAATHPTS